jgi:hypothetical protein
LVWNPADTTCKKNGLLLLLLMFLKFCVHNVCGASNQLRNYGQIWVLTFFCPIRRSEINFLWPNSKTRFKISDYLLVLIIQNITITLKFYGQSHVSCWIGLKNSGPVIKSSYYAVYHIPFLAVKYKIISFYFISNCAFNFDMSVLKLLGQKKIIILIKVSLITTIFFLSNYSYDYCDAIPKASIRLPY